MNEEMKVREYGLASVPPGRNCGITCEDPFTFIVHQSRIVWMQLLIYDISPERVINKQRRGSVLGWIFVAIDDVILILARWTEAGMALGT